MNMLQNLGTTNLTVSRIGLGLASLGRPGYINIGHGDDLAHDYDIAAMEARAHIVLDAAWDAGVRYFDAARSYGRAEQFLGSWLQKRGLSPDGVTVGSKWGYTYTADWQISAEKHEVKEHSLPVLQRQWEESQTILGKNLQLYQIHSATLDSGVLENSAVLNELARRKAAGMAIGLSVSGTGQGATIERALEIEIDGVRLFDAVQATWNVLEISAESALKAAHAAGLGVIIKEALANGRLTSRNDMPSFTEKRQLLEAQAARHNTTIDGLAIAAVLAQPWVSVVLSGAARVDHLLSNLAAADVVFDWEFGMVVDSAETYWQTRSSLAWN